VHSFYGVWTDACFCGRSTIVKEEEEEEEEEIVVFYFDIQ
jgi:transcription elongation factor Elf1